MFYEIFIKLRVSQIKNFQTIIKRLPPNIIEKKQAEIPTFYRINILNWITAVIFVPHPQSFCIIKEFNWWRKGKRIEIINYLQLRFHKCCHPMSSISHSVIEINYTTTSFVNVVFAISRINPLEIRNFQKIHPFQKIKITERNIFPNWFHRIAPRRGILLDGLFGPNIIPRPFFLPLPSHEP